MISLGSSTFRKALLVLLAFAAVSAGIVAHARAGDAPKLHEQVIIPEEDRFSPFALTIHVGDSVRWTNMDTDDHTVVSDDFFNTAGHNGTDHLILGTDNNNGQPGIFTLTFHHKGTFVYYCRFHSMLDDDHQPKAPGPDGGIQDADGNHGTPMMGVITVLPKGDDHDD